MRESVSKYRRELPVQILELDRLYVTARKVRHQHRKTTIYHFEPRPRLADGDKADPEEDA